jgi:hypothetical protein
MDQCPRCGTPFDSLHAASQHLWKSEDGDHDDVTELDDAIHAVAQYDGELPDGDRDGDGSDPDPGTVDDGPDRDGEPDHNYTDSIDDGDDGDGIGGDVVPDSEPHPDPDPTPATDGGRESPPVPSTESNGPPPVDDAGDDGDTRTVDELPERYVPVGTYLAEAANQLGDVEADQLREALSPFDVVDVAATDTETITAYELGDVPQ